MMNRTFLNFINSWFRLPYTWMILVVVFFNILFAKVPQLTEMVYSNGLYQIIRYVYDYTFGNLPFPMVYLLFFGLVIGLGYWIKRLIEVGKISLATLGRKLVYNIYQFVAVSFFLFYFLWGFNYQRIPFDDKLNLTSTKVENEYILNEVREVSIKMDSLRELIVPDGVSIDQSKLIPGLETAIRIYQKELFKSWGYKSGSKVRIRKLEPKGTLLRISTAGVYIPFVLEGHIDKGLHPIQWPSTLAHEMAHGYGQTDEGVCNFIGMLTCLKSKDPLIQYSGWMMYLRYLLKDLRKKGITEFKETFNLVPKSIVDDIVEIQTALRKYPDLFPKARNVIYDQYLKSHGVKEGIVSYSTIIQMVSDWKQSSHNDGSMD